LDGNGPWGDANWQLGAKQFGALLRDAEYQVRTISPEQLADEKPNETVLIAAPSLERLPFAAFQAIAAHTARGGSLLASGGEPFRQPLYRSGGTWVTAQELLLRAPRTIVVTPAKTRLSRSSNQPEGVVSQRTVAGPEGKQDSLEVKIAKPIRVDLMQTEPFAASPFAGGAITTIVSVRGTPEESLLIEWRETPLFRAGEEVPP
jgi:hypothetical protein